MEISLIPLLMNRGPDVRSAVTLSSENIAIYTSFYDYYFIYDMGVIFYRYFKSVYYFLLNILHWYQMKYFKFIPHIPILGNECAIFYKFSHFVSLKLYG